MTNDSRFRFAALGVLTLAVALSVSPATAQTMGAVKVNLAYDVTVGHTTLPAGEYLIRPLQSNDNSCILEFSLEGGRRSIVAMAIQIPAPDNHPSTQSEITLRHAGGKYEVDKVYFEGHDYGYQLLPVIPPE